MPTDSTESNAGQQPSRDGSRAKLVIAGILAILCLVVFFQNLETVTVQLFFWPVTMAKILLMLLMAFIGLVIGWILATLRKRAQS
ncbi:MAG: LapA family protein [bacterium]